MMQDALGRLFALVYDIAKLSDDEVLILHRTMLNRASLDTVAKTSDPALSDLLSSEVEIQLEGFLRGVEKIRGMAAKQ